MRIEINEHIVSDSEICGGTPTFNGTRIMVWQILELLAVGMPIGEIKNYYVVELTEEQINSALVYASTLAKGDNYARTKISAR